MYAAGTRHSSLQGRIHGVSPKAFGIGLHIQAVASEITDPDNSPHSASAKATAVSSMRLENPHSLSYQLHTLTSLPITRVNVES